MNYMRLALDLAKDALGTTSPNPAVGAVLVKSGHIIGKGYTQKPGQAHAEICAINQAGNQTENSTLYVTLEPCSHHGRTPPCTSAIIQAGITKVHMALLDPNPLINGLGKKELENAGIAVAVGDREEEATQINEAYLKFTRTGLPFITAKYAASLDGKIGTRTGDSHWITGNAARRKANQLRDKYDAIMVGIGTVLKDDPRLTARNDQNLPLPQQPLRVIVDSNGRTPTTANLFEEPGEILIATGPIEQSRVKALEKSGATVVEFPTLSGVVDLRELMRFLGHRQTTSILIEGGGGLLGSVIEYRLADKLVVFLAPMIIGGVNAIPSIGGLGSEKISDSLRLERITFQHEEGDHLIITGYPKKKDTQD